MNDVAALLPIILLVLVFYFFIMRPQSKRRREFLDMQQKVEIGSRVMITSGIFGTVVALGDDTMTLSIAPGVEIEVHRNVVAKIVDPTLPASEPAVDEVAERPRDDENGTA
ncbi:preprotein translocase subunit YajC [Mumia zhuanghuii]|uniref:Preprotein translocase subunit YajC n=1 Tax=Mumia zhuanghuii TaxID=2585211 RepID=A0A5C4MHJ1_9ACTN|nr:preprotein translocase subunit YajC [Mumia zhuanghuii]TNC29840.1 preprotein translocase subunit YajC [Mumia zhuanghuii]TNC37111.1 preprotein translocase subunit YajC [Mumia zhuanghuii]